MNKIKLFTHTDLDGIGCAILAYLAFDEENVDVVYCDYKDVDEKIKEFINELNGLHNPQRKIFITDISVNEETAKYLDKQWHDVTLLDHHATAIRLNDHSWCNVRVCDKVGVKTSGTMMFYRYLEREGYFDKYRYRIAKNVERFAEVVRDYDTWRWKEKLGDEGFVCKQLNDLFHIYGRDKFVEWALYNIINMGQVPYFTEKDRALLEQKQKDIDNYIAIKDKQIITICDNFGYNCGIVFAERYFSDLGNKLSELHPELDYIAMIDMGYGVVSYRTIRDDIDLGEEIAHSFGGGGHRKAAGSTFDARDMSYIVLGNIFELERFSTEI